MKAGFQNITQIVTKIAGSAKRVEALQKVQAADGVNLDKLLSFAATRFGSHETMTTRFDKMKVQVYKVPGRSIETAHYKADAWACDLEKAKNSLPQVDLSMPLFRTVSAWTQVLCMDQMPTISLVRLQIRDFRHQIQLMKIAGDALSLSDDEEQRDLGRVSLDMYESFRDSASHYYDRIYNDPIYMLAEYLDIRVFNLVSYDDMLQIKEFLSSFEEIDERDRCQRNDSGQGITVTLGGLSAPAPAPRRASSSFNARQSTIPLFETAMGQYNTFMETFDAEKIVYEDPLKFWGERFGLFPIMAMLAQKILHISATNGTLESMFSVVGKIVSIQRSSLTPENVDRLACLYEWVRDKEGVVDPRHKGRFQRASRFIAKKSYESYLRLYPEVPTTVAAEPAMETSAGEAASEVRVVISLIPVEPEIVIFEVEEEIEEIGILTECLSNEALVAEGDVDVTIPVVDARGDESVCRPWGDDTEVEFD